MNPLTSRFTVPGPVGALECLRDVPDPTAWPVSRGIALIAHPHPLFGGTMDNKVVQTMARAAVACGWEAIRFNFRGVGASQGVYDEGRGEVDDALAVLQSCTAEAQNLAVPFQQPIVLAGFSFGSHVISHLISKIFSPDVIVKSSHYAIEKIVFVGTATSRFAVAPLPPELHTRSLIIHGEVDDTVPLADVMDWARPQFLPVTVIPAAAHFFHGQLPLLKSLVARHLL
jgi:alpha/beta superfamily hydrolase